MITKQFRTSPEREEALWSLAKIVVEFERAMNLAFGQQHHAQVTEVVDELVCALAGNNDFDFDADDDLNLACARLLVELSDTVNTVPLGEAARRTFFAIGD